MNRIYKVIYSKARQCYIVVSELAKSNHKSSQQGVDHTNTPALARIIAVALAAGALTWGSVPEVSWAADTTQGGGDGVAIGTGSNAPKVENVAIGKGASISYSGGVGQPSTGDIVIGGGAHINNYIDQGGGIAIGANSFVENMTGGLERSFDFNQAGYDSFFGIPYGYPYDPSKMVTGVAIGQNTYARSGSIMLGTHNYKGVLGDVTVDSANTKAQNMSLFSTTLGANSYSNGLFSSVTGAYSIASSNYNGGENATKNFGATITGSLNSIESDKSSSEYSGVANSIVGVANRASNSNGSLIFGAGNEIKNSITAISAPESGGDSAKALQDSLMKAVQKSKSGGATLVIGGGNKANYTQKAQILGVANTITGTESNIAMYNMVDGYQNTVTEASHVKVLGQNVTINEGADSNTVFGDYRTVAADQTNNVIIGNADEKEPLTTSNKETVILGYKANTKFDGGVALGSDAIASTNAASADKNAVGYNPKTGKASEDPSATWRSTNAAVSIGRAEEKNDKNEVTSTAITRQLTNLAAGTQDTDAVNVAQLKAAQTHFYSVNSDETTAGNYNNDGATGRNALAAGVSAIASGQNATAVGTTTQAQGNNSSAFGYQAIAFNTDSTAIGSGATAQNDRAIAIGGHALGVGSIQIGTYSTANSENAVAVGGYAIGESSVEVGSGSTAQGNSSVSVGGHAIGKNSVAIGRGETSSAGENSTAIGGGHTMGNNNVAIGMGTSTSGSYATTVGGSSTADYAVSVGNSANATKEQAVAIGYSSTATGKASTAINAHTTAEAATAVGGANATFKAATAIGNRAEAVAEQATAIGDNTTANGTHATAIGGASAGGENSTAIGKDSTVSKKGSTAIGGAHVNGEGAAAIGTGATINGDNGVAVGTQANVSKQSTGIGYGVKAAESGTSIGYGAQSNVQATAIGMNVYANKNAVAVGGNAWGENSVAIGQNSGTNTSAVAIGQNSGAWGENSVAIGQNTNAWRADSIVLGMNSKSAGGEGIQGYDPKTGTASTDNESVAWKSTNAAVSIGRAEEKDKDGNLTATAITRQLSNLAAGTQDTDAVNVAQLKNVMNMPVHIYSGGTINTTGTQITNNMTISNLQLDFGDGLKAQEVGNDGDKRVLVTLDKDALKNDPAFKGPKGDKGDTGAQGPKGDKGDTGAQGSKGDKGDTGAQGPKGDKGDTGAQGPKGDKGDTGTQGPAGKDGKDGKDGGVGTVTDDGSNITVTNTETDSTKPANYQVSLKKDINIDSVTADKVTAKEMTTDRLTINKDVSIEQGSKNAVNAGTVYNETRVKQDGKYVKASNTAGQNITALDNQVASNASNITNINGRVNNLDSKVNKVGAGAAALAALHPLDFDPDDKWDFAVGYGNYRDANSAAVGAFYRPDDDTMFSIGTNFGNGENMINAGVSFKFGPKGKSQVRPGSTQEITELRATVARQDDQLKKQDSEIKELKAMVQQLMAKQDKQAATK